MPPPITIQTTTTSTESSATQHPPSPTAPPMSPITPPPGANRQSFTHSTQTDQTSQTAVAPPAPEPIDFDNNPDAIALKSAISILQIQKQRAARDVQTLNKVREEALSRQDEFVKDLVEGKVKTGQDGVLSRPLHAKDEDDEGDSDDSEGGERAKQEKEKIWTTLPAPQNVVRCPPINWSQYAVVGESLDKLHDEQVKQPSQGAPATLGPNGTYNFKAGQASEEPYRGVAAPYEPGKDKIDRKKKNSKR